LAFAVDGEALAPKLEITKTASADTVAPGGEISYTITVSVTGAPDEAMPANQFVTDLLPDGLTYVEDSLKWEGTKDLASEAHFGPKALNATLYTQSQNGDKEEFLYTGQSITFTYRAKVDTGVAVGDELTNMAAISDGEELSNTSKVTVTVVAPANDDPADSGAADADTTAKAENALDSSPKCGDSFLLGWLFKLLGIGN
ncbi:MAG: isopeptide-forming domain-containing fimbrial protein, partial [Firmicutes bacterium]|nr:isopeptide-forming domain-containing fimbrial protein [Bacillota bacterium]